MPGAGGAEAAGSGRLRHQPGAEDDPALARPLRAAARFPRGEPRRGGRRRRPEVPTAEPRHRAGREGSTGGHPVEEASRIGRGRLLGSVARPQIARARPRTGRRRRGAPWVGGGVGRHRARRAGPRVGGAQASGRHRGGGGPPEHPGGRAGPERGRPSRLPAGRAQAGSAGARHRPERTGRDDPAGHAHRCAPLHLGGGHPERGGGGGAVRPQPPSRPGRSRPASAPARPRPSTAGAAPAPAP
jgi:hypothetical protein